MKMNSIGQPKTYNKFRVVITIVGFLALAGVCVFLAGVLPAAGIVTSAITILLLLSFLAGLWSSSAPTWLRGTSFALVGLSTEEPLLEVSFFGSTVRVAGYDVPEDYGIEDAEISIAEFAPAQMAITTETDPSQLAVANTALHNQLSTISTSVPGYRAGSLRKLLFDLNGFYVAMRKRNIEIVKMVLDAHRQRFSAAVSEERAEQNRKIAQHSKTGANNAAKQTGGVAAGAAVGAILGTVVPALGTGLGAGIGAGLGWLGGLLAGEEIEKPDVASDAELKNRAGHRCGYGDDPEQRFKEIAMEHALKLWEADSATIEVSVSAYESLLRRSLHEAQDGLVLAQTASIAFNDASEIHTQALAIWEEGSGEYIRASKQYEKATKSMKKARNALLLSVAVGALMEQFQSYGEMTTRQYRQELATNGVDLSGKDIDHILPRSGGGVDHPWNYQAVEASLNRSWQDGHLFEKCLQNPTGFAKAVVINYPVLDGVVAGGAYYGASKMAETDNE